MKIIFFISSYCFVALLYLLFIRCASYYESRAIITYEKELDFINSRVIDEIIKFNNKTSKLVYSSSIAGSIYRVMLYDEFLMNDIALSKLNFSKDETDLIKNNIRPGLEERISIFKHMHYTTIFGIISLGIIIGSLL